MPKEVVPDIILANIDQGSVARKIKDKVDTALDKYENTLLHEHSPLSKDANRFLRERVGY